MVRWKYSSFGALAVCDENKHAEFVDDVPNQS